MTRPTSGPAANLRARLRSHRTSVGALAVSGAGAVRLALQLALLPILARMVGPSDYGLVALALPFIMITNVLADGGLVGALARTRDVTPRLESSIFWISAAGGLALTLLVCAAAWPIGLAMREPRLPPLLMALSPILLLNGLSVVSNGKIIRERRFAIYAGGDLIATVAAASTALAVATQGGGAWALVAQQLVLWVCKLAWVTFKARPHVGLALSLGEARAPVIFGAKSVGSTLADFASRNVDNMIIGAVLGATALGYYAMAYQVIRIPDMLISGPLYLYTFTAVSRVANADDREAVRSLARAGLRLTAVIIAPLFLGLALVADLAVRLLLGEKWLGAIAPLRWLTVAGFGFCLCSMIAAMLNGMGRAGLQLRLSLTLGVLSIVAVAGAARFGITATSAALALGVLVATANCLHRLAHHLKTSRLRLLAAFGPAALGCAALAAAVLATRAALDGQPDGVTLAASILAGAAAYVSVIWTCCRRQLGADGHAFSRAQGDTAAAAPQAAAPDAAAASMA